ncbi:MAG: DUF302 domain-containing protein [Gammaproteobacteria bacterium]
MKTRSFFLLLLLSLLPATQLLAESPVTAHDTVFKLVVDQPADAVYGTLYKHLEEARFFVVFEPNIGNNLANFSERWGENYNRNKLTSLRSIVFCNAWYANQVSNLDPDMLGLCPLHASVVGRDGKTTILFNRPTIVAANSPALKLIRELEEDVIKSIKAGFKSDASKQ